MTGEVIEGDPRLTWREVLRDSGYAPGDELPAGLVAACEQSARSIFLPLRERFGAPIRVVGALIREPNCPPLGPPAPFGGWRCLGLAYCLQPVTGGLSATLELWGLALILQELGTIPLGGLAVSWVHGREGGCAVLIDRSGRRSRWNQGDLNRLRDAVDAPPAGGAD